MSAFLSRPVGSLVDDAVLHDDDEVPAGIADDVDVGERVAVDEDEIGKRPFLDNAKPAGIRRQLF